MKSIVLCGFMGCGKSTAGKLLAEQLQFDFVDMDIFIEEQVGQKISNIFTKQGETFFRRLEADACAVLSGRLNTVIAAGGGTLISPDNAAALAATCTIIWIDVPFNILAERLAGDKSRPLFVDMDAARVLYERRRPVYRKMADFIVDGSLPSETVAKKIRELVF